MERFVERKTFARLRRLLWDRVSGGRVLEVGVGTGKNIPYYPEKTRVTAVDLSPKMLKSTSSSTSAIRRLTPSRSNRVSWRKLRPSGKLSENKAKRPR